MTTTQGGALEIVDGSCGVLVPADTGALAGALGRLLRDPGECARRGEWAGVGRTPCDPAARLREQLVTVAGERAIA